MTQRFYNKYCNNLNKIKDLNHDNDNILFFLKDNGHQRSIVFQLEVVILEELFHEINYFQYMNCDTHDSDYIHIIENIETCETYKDIISDLESIMTNYNINEDYISKEYVKEFKQMMNNYIKNNIKTLKKHKIFITNIENKSKKLKNEF